PGPDEAQRVEIELVEAGRRLPDLVAPPPPGCGRIGLVEAADVLEVSPQRLDRRRRLELREDGLRPGLGRERRDGPRDRAVVDDLEDLREAREPVARGAHGIDSVQEAGRDERRENDAGGIELAEVEQAA